jgi:hypothetical protein
MQKQNRILLDDAAIGVTFWDPAVTLMLQPAASDFLDYRPPEMLEKVRFPGARLDSR